MKILTKKNIFKHFGGITYPPSYSSILGFITCCSVGATLNRFTETLTVKPIIATSLPRQVEPCGAVVVAGDPRAAVGPRQAERRLVFGQTYCLLCVRFAVGSVSNSWLPEQTGMHFERADKGKNVCQIICCM